MNSPTLPARIIVTGAASGIGRATALLAAARGSAVVVSDRDADGLTTVAADILAAGGTVAAVPGDAANPTLVEALVATSVERHGGLEGFVANAGLLNSVDPILELELDAVAEVLRVNLLGPLLALQQAGRFMRDHGGGAIVCTASVAALRSGAGPAHYSASKAAVVSLVQSAACQLAGTGVRVNAVCPGLIETGMTRPVFEIARAQGKEGKIGQLNPLRRAGQPEEVAEAILFLLGSGASYVNGTTLVVDGGLAASLPVVPGRLW